MGNIDFPRNFVESTIPHDEGIIKFAASRMRVLQPTPTVHATSFVDIRIEKFYRKKKFTPGAFVEDTTDLPALNKGAARVPIPPSDIYSDVKTGVKASVNSSSTYETQTLAKVLDRSIGGNAKLKGHKSDNVVQLIRNLDDFADDYLIAASKLSVTAARFTCSTHHTFPQREGFLRQVPDVKVVLVVLICLTVTLVMTLA